MSTMNKVVVFINRDGVLNENPNLTSDLIKPDEFHFIQGSPVSIKNLNYHDIKVIVYSTESGIGTTYTEEQYLELNNYIMERLRAFGGKVDWFYYTINSNDDPKSDYIVPMIDKAIRDHKLESYKKYLIGDELFDIIAGNITNCVTFLVKTGNGENEYKNINNMYKTPRYYMDDINQVSKEIIEREVKFENYKVIDNLMDENEIIALENSSRTN